MDRRCNSATGLSRLTAPETPRIARPFQTTLLGELFCSLGAASPAASAQDFQIQVARLDDFCAVHLRRLARWAAQRCSELFR